MEKTRAIEPTKFVFVVGTPGAGKSLFCRELLVILRGSGFECSSHGDYPFLQALYRHDIGVGRTDRFNSDPKSEFVVLDTSVYDEALKIIYESILSASTNSRTVKIVEFSRPSYDTAFLYYTLRALGECVIVHILAPMGVCTERNERRKQILEARLTGVSPHPFDEDPDLHYVPPSVMRSFYANDAKEDIRRGPDQKLVLSLLPTRGYFCIDNSGDDKVSFRVAVRNVVERQLLPLFEHGESYEEYYYRRHEHIAASLSVLGPPVGPKQGFD
jgi:hypothetical protein